MENAKKVILYAIAATIMIISCHKETLNSPATITPGSVVLQQASNSIFGSTWSHNCFPWLTNLWCLQWVGGAIFQNHSYNSNFDSAYYDDHVRVSIKQADAAVWINAPYVAHDHTGQNNYDLYFTDDNYVVNFPFGTINAPRIIIIAKTGAPFDFSKQVSVKIVFI